MAQRKTNTINVNNKLAIVFALVFCFAGGFALKSSLAAPKGSTGSGTTSSIKIANINGTAYNASNNTPAPKLGDKVTFNTTIEKLAGGWEYPMIAVSCYQDVNNDGQVDINLLGPDVVFTWLDHPDVEVQLGGYSSIWTLRGGGAATCRADLDAYGWKGGKQSIRVLSTTGQWQVAGQ